MNVLFINRCFGPNMEATGQILDQLCQQLPRDTDGQPMRIDVVAGKVPQGMSRQITRHGNEIRVRRVWHVGFAKSSRVGRLFSLVSFGVLAFLVSFFRRRPDVIVTMTDPFFLPVFGTVLKRWHGCRYVTYLQDIYPDIAVVVGEVKESKNVSRLRRFLFWAIRQADLVIVLSRDMARTCLEQGIPQERVVIVANWSDTSAITPVKTSNPFRERHGLDGKFVVMYSGNMGRAHILEPLIDAAKCFRDDPEKMFVFVGEGAQKDRLIAMSAELGLTNTLFLPYQPQADLAASLSAADVQVVSMLPGADRCLMPSKVYGIMASGTPMLGLCSTTSELGEMITELKIGFVCDPEDAEDLTERMTYAINYLASDRDFLHDAGRRARQLATEQYDCQIQARRFQQVLMSVTGESTKLGVEVSPVVADSHEVVSDFDPRLVEVRPKVSRLQ